MKDKSKITFIFIHGSWQSSIGWEIVSELLQDEGYTTVLVDLPGHGNSKKDFLDISLSTYVAHVVDIIKCLPKDNKVVLVGHSMGGIVISQIAATLRVDSLIYVAAFLPIHGENLIDIAKHSKIDGVSKNMNFDPTNKSITLSKYGLENIFYNDCDQQTIDIAFSRLQHEPLQPFLDRVQLNELYTTTPKNYIECTKDNSLSIDLQKWMCNRLDCTVHSLDSGHAPFYSNPKSLTKILIECLQ